MICNKIYKRKNDNSKRSRADWKKEQRKAYEVMYQQEHSR